MKKALLISCFDWFKARLAPIRDLLICQGYDVSILTSDFNHIKKRTVDERFSECTYIHVHPYKKNLSLDRIISHLYFGKQAAEFIEKEKPDLIYLLLPPNNIAKYCALYKRKNPNIKFIIDIIDLWPESMPIGVLQRTPFAWLWKKWRDKAIKVADHVFTECDLYQDRLAKVLEPSKTTTLHLYKEQTEEERKLVQDIINSKKQDDIIRFAYLGSMNNIVDIEGICKVLKEFISIGKKCEFHAIGDGESRDRFEKSVRETGCDVHFYGKVFDEIEKIKILSPCDYAFNMMKGSISVGLTIKSIDYLSYGLPLINNIKGDTWKLVEKYRIGINVCEKILIDEKIDHKRVVLLFEEFFSKETFVNAFNKYE